MTEEIYTREAGQSTASAVSFKQRVRAGLFAKVPLEVATTEKLSPAAKQIWITLACLQGDNGRSWPGLQTLAKYAGLSLSGTKKALKELRAKGFLKHRYDNRKKRHVFSLAIPADVVREFCERTGAEDLLARTQTSPSPCAASGGSRPKAQREIDPRAEWEAWNDVGLPDYLRKKYENVRAEDAEWNGFLTKPTAQSADQDDKEGHGTQMGTGEYPNGYGAVPKRVLESTQTGTPVEGSAQTGTASAGAYKTFIDKTLDKTFYKKGENSLKDLASNGEESKSKQNFQLGEEEKVGLEPKSSSAEPETFEETSKNELPSSSKETISPSAGDPVPSTPFRGLVVDPKTGRVENYANLPPWARYLVAGLSNLRREREILLKLLSEAQGAEKVMIQARLREMEAEIADAEARLAEILAEAAGQTSGSAEAPVAVGGELRG
jgi:hypothetical protein